MSASILDSEDVILFDSNAQIGEKIKISGGARCNFTNAKLSVQNYLGDEAFIAPALQSFSNSDLLEFFKAHNLAFEERKEAQYFCSKSAKDILAIFSKSIKKSTLKLRHKVLKVTKEKEFHIHTNNGTFLAKKLIVASGGLSYASIGASDIGYEIAKSFGHRVISPAPALVGFTLQKEQFFLKELSGISFRAKAFVEGRELEGDILFAHRGISGPLVLNASLFWQRGKIVFDFLPNQRIDFKSNKQLSTILPLPKRFSKLFLAHLGLEDKKTKLYTKAEQERLNALKNYAFAPAGNFGYTKAEVTKGGVDSAEIDPHTFASTKIKNLYFIGEVLNVTGMLGGYNFQWAFSSGYSCANAIKE